MSGLGGFCPLPLRLGGSATEGWTSAQHARAAADLVALVRAAPFAVVTAAFDAMGVCTLVSYCGQHGVGAAQAPTLTSGGASITFTWPAQYTDEYGGSYPVNLRHGLVGVHRAAGYHQASVSFSTPSAATVLVTDGLGGLLTGTVTLAVW